MNSHPVDLRREAPAVNSPERELGVETESLWRPEDTMWDVG
jgi:hypothetical protein